MWLRFSGLSRVEHTHVLSSAGNSYNLESIETALRLQHPYVHKYNRERRSPAAYAVDPNLEPIEEDYDDGSLGARGLMREPPVEEDDFALAAEVELHFEPQRDVSAPRDVAALQLVLRNLLDNAIKFSPPGAAIQIALSVDQGYACIVVSDEGRGLNQQEVEQAFQPFFRGDDKASGGTGLGLHLVQEMMVAHGGSAHVDSPGRDQGSTFTLRLPLEQTS